MKLLTLPSLFVRTLALVLVSGGAAAQSAAPDTDKSATEIAKKLQNPIGDLISVPFQNNTNFDFGHFNKTQNVLNIQPVIPIHITPDWNIITRTILPVIAQPRLAPKAVPDFGESHFGLGNTILSLFLSPRNPGKFIWGIGPVFMLPTNTDKALGPNQWGAGPTGVVLRIDGPWVYGALINNVWSFSGSQTRGTKVNAMTLQPFVNYNFSGGWYLTSSPIITANWLAIHEDQTWTVPVGGGFGKVIKIGGKLPVNLSLQGYANPVHPSGIGPTWTIRSTITFIF
jgi:hypothetical protein